MDSLLLDGLPVLTWSDIGYGGAASIFIYTGFSILFRKFILKRSAPKTTVETIGTILGCLVLAALPFATIFSGHIYEDGKIRIYEFTMTHAPIPREVHLIGIVVSLPLAALFFYLVNPISEWQIKNAQMRRDQMRCEQEKQAANWIRKAINQQRHGPMNQI